MTDGLAAAAAAAAAAAGAGAPGINGTYELRCKEGVKREEPFRRRGSSAPYTRSLGADSRGGRPEHKFCATPAETTGRIE